MTMTIGIGWGLTLLVPFVGDAFERFHAVIAKARSGAGNQVLDGARDKHFARRCQRRDAGADMDHDPADLLAHDLAFASVETVPDLEPERLDTTRYGAGAADCARGAIEYGFIAGLVSIVIVASLTAIGASLTNTFTAVNGAFAGAGN
jgi:Flp pilus assembly pilin Flp